MEKGYTLPLGQKLNPQHNPHTMDYQKLYRHMAIEHGLFLLDSQMEEIVDIVLEMHNENPEKCTMKTAVKELYEILWETDKDKFTWIAILDDILEKEKEQIVNAYKKGCFDGGFFDEKWDEERAKEYYNETYGGQ